MTASWGGFGVMWGKNVAVTVLRPQRYTKEFIDQTDSFTLSFYDDTFKKDLSYLGSVSGRDEDKISKTRLTPTDANGIPYFEEAKIVLICKNCMLSRWIRQALQKQAANWTGNGIRKRIIMYCTQQKLSRFW